MALIFHNLVSVEEAKRHAANSIKRIDEQEEIPVVQSLGRVLSMGIYSDIDSPPFDRSEVDGYAVYSGDVEEAEQDHPVALKIEDTAAVGEGAKKLLRRGSCVRIATGAVIPVGCDSVVMVEYAKEENGSAKIFRSLKPGENVSRSGGDLSRGELALRMNSVIGPREIAVFSSIGISKVKVYRKLRIAIISTGNELIEPGCKLLPGKLFESNGATIKSILDQYGVFQTDYKGIVKDDKESIRKAIFSLLENYDAIVTSGSTSAGEGDMIYDILRNLVPGIIFHGVEIKPGKPTLLAIGDGKPIIGLPGFPVSAVMVFETIFLPALFNAVRINCDQKAVEADLPVRVNLNMGKLNLIPVSIVKRHKNIAYPILGDSGSVSRLIRSDGYISAYGDRAYLDEGETHNVTFFSESSKIPDLTFIGSHDIAVESIFSRIGLDVKVINIGSMGGIGAVRRGEADIAGVHILDPLTMKYNYFGNDEKLMEKAILVKGYKRKRGIIVCKGNPKGIRSISDIKESRARFVNRNQGSGTRMLINKLLKDNVIMPKQIINFNYEVKTHNAVANAIWSGRADAGIAIKQAATIYGLDFIPIGDEEYDFLILKESMDKLSPFIEALKSTWFLKELEEKFEGYSV